MRKACVAAARVGICGRLPYNRRMARDRQLILNRYRPIGEAKAGGFGTVRVAWDTRIQRKVAIKCIELDEVDAARAALPGANAVAQRAPQHEPLPWEDDPVFNDADEAEGDATSVFDLVGDGPLVHSLAHVPGLDEARTAAMLSDASIVAVYDFEVQESTAYLIMEYVEGVTLTELLHRHADRLTLDVVAAVFASVSHALEVAHANQVLHLDIKPDNVLINHQGQVKVTDFGLATLADASGYGAAGGGTIGYMPLEQMRQENLDVRCDEWALASLTYEMLAGENPFLAPDLERAEAVIEDAELVLPSLCWDELDPAVDDVIFFALDPDREERYATVADFAEELEPFLGDPKRGVRELSVIVGHADDEEEEETETAPPVPYVPLRERITPLQRTVAAHAAGALGSGAVAFVAFANLPQTSGFANPLFWGLFALVTLAGALKPHLGALLAYFALSAALIAGNAPAAGCVLLAATAAWWYFTGRLGDADANATLVPPLAGAFGCNQLTPLVAGFCLPPARAFGALAFSLLVSVTAGFVRVAQPAGLGRADELAVLRGARRASQHRQSVDAAGAVVHRDQLDCGYGCAVGLPPAPDACVRRAGHARGERSAAGGHRPGRLGRVGASNLDAVLQQPRVHARSHRGDAAHVRSRPRAGLLRGRLRGRSVNSRKRLAPRLIARRIFRARIRHKRCCRAGPLRSTINLNTIL